MKVTGKRVAIAAGALALAVLGLASWHSRAYFRLWWRFHPLGPNAQGYPEYRHRKTGIIFVRLPGGTFVMGSPDDEGGRSVNEFQHKVTVGPFLIAKHELSQAEWKRVMASNPSGFKGDDLPVDSVSREDCHTFCQATGLALPTEAQWEYACRAGTSTAFGGTGCLDDMGWYSGNSGGQTHACGEKAANSFGLHDMHGNVWERCEDVPDTSYWEQKLLGADLIHAGSRSGFIRGGSWRMEAKYCRSAFRCAEYPSALRDECLGLRPAYGPSP